MRSSSRPPKEATREDKLAIGGAIDSNVDADETVARGIPSPASARMLEPWPNRDRSVDVADVVVENDTSLLERCYERAAIVLRLHAAERCPTVLHHEPHAMHGRELGMRMHAPPAVPGVLPDAGSQKER